MSSEKWYWSEPFLFEGEATVTAVGSYQEKLTLTIDRSLFYPEGGGQLGDRGAIVFAGNTRQILDTQIDEHGNIFLIMDDTVPADTVGKTVHLHVNEEWRRRQMSQHTGQHLLSRLLQDRYHAPTVSARLGEHTFSLDVEAALFTQEQQRAIEDELNLLILEDRPIRAWFPTTEELAQLSLRKQPSVDEQIRIIHVEGFDVTPCGGTHCVRTGQVGMVHIQSVEKYKHLVRIIANAGLDAVRDFHKKEDVLRQAQTLLSATTETIIPQIELLQIRQGELQVQLKERMIQLAKQEATKQLVTKSEGGFISIELATEDIEYARILAKEIAKQRSIIAIVSCPTGDGVFVVLDRVEKGPLDLGMILKETLALQGGKGGGGPLHAEGRGHDTSLLELLKQRLAPISIP